MALDRRQRAPASRAEQVGQHRLTPEHDQRLILHTAAPGTETAVKLELLRVIGLQRLAPETSR